MLPDIRSGYVPVSSASVSASQNGASPALRILVADDNVDVLTTMRVLLESEGYAVRTVGDGGAAIDAAREFRPDVCILDIGMPVQTGYAVASELRTMYGSRRPLLIAISGQWGNASEKAVAASMGFDHFLQKPADPEHVFSLLRELAATSAGRRY